LLELASFVRLALKDEIKFIRNLIKKRKFKKKRLIKGSNRTPKSRVS